VAPRDSTRCLRIGLIVAGLLIVAVGRTYAALDHVPAPQQTANPFAEASSPPEVTGSTTTSLSTTPATMPQTSSIPTPRPPPTGTPSAGWLGRELDPIIIEGGWNGIVRVWVPGQVGLPVTIRSADGGWSAVNFVGTKPEYGPDALEFAPLWPGPYVIDPQGLGASLAIDLAPGHIAQVRFEPGRPATPPPTHLPTATPTPSPPPPPTPAPTILTPTLPITLASAPELVDPPDGTAISIRIRLDHAWTWDGVLGPDDYFQVEVWNSYNDFSTPIDVAWVKVSTYKYDSNPNPAYGVEYRWRITVVRGIPAREKDWSTPETQVWDPGRQPIQVSEESTTWVLLIDPGCPPGVRSC
jgi:hypothetical protein